jgi:hypothetical protein
VERASTANGETVPGAKSEGDMELRKSTLPSNVDTLIARLKQKKTMYRDQVIQIIVEHYGNDDDLMALLEAEEDEDAVTGSVAFDDFKLTMKVAEIAEAEKISMLSQLSLARLHKAVRPALKALGLQRKGRPGHELDDQSERAA